MPNGAVSQSSPLIGAGQVNDEMVGRKYGYLHTGLLLALSFIYRGGSILSWYLHTPYWRYA